MLVEQARRSATTMETGRGVAAHVREVRRWRWHNAAHGHQKEHALDGTLAAFDGAARIERMGDERADERKQPNDQRGREGLDALL